MDANTNGGNITVVLENVLLSYCYIFQPFETTYCTHAIMLPNHPGIELVKAAQRKAAQFKWGEKWQEVLGQLALQHRVALHPGELKADKEGYAGNFFVSANSKVPPRVVVTRNGVNVEIGANDPHAPYSGCRGTVIVDIWPQSSQDWGKRINAQLTGVQFLGHGKRFGGGRVAKVDEFGIAPADADGAVPGASQPSESASSLI